MRSNDETPVVTASEREAARAAWRRQLAGSWQTSG